MERKTIINAQSADYCFNGKEKIMPRNKQIKKVLVIGSGPIIIGQAEVGS